MTTAKTIISFLIVLVLVSSFSGCAPQWDTPLASNPEFGKEANIFSYPSLNVETTTEIGQNMHEKAYGMHTLDVKLLKRAKGESMLLWVDSEKMPYQASGQEFPYLTIQEHKKNKLISINNTTNGLCYTQYICLTDLNNDGNFTHFSAQGDVSFQKLDASVPYKTIPSFILLGQNSFKQIVLYQGRVGNKIKISFREFKDDIARPAFTQDIEYELEKDGTTVIGFKGLRVEVLKATNMDITYKVVKDYN